MHFGIVIIAAIVTYNIWGEGGGVLWVLGEWVRWGGELTRWLPLGLSSSPHSPLLYSICATFLDDMPVQGSGGGDGGRSKRQVVTQLCVCYNYGCDAHELVLGVGGTDGTILPMHITNHVRHLCNTVATIWDDLHSRMTKGNTLRPFAMSYTILQYYTVLAFTSTTFSNLFWCF